MSQSEGIWTERPVLPGYQISRRIAQTAHSVVYRAFREENRQPVILKVLKTDSPIPDELIRYRQEYEITRRLSSAGVIPAYDLETIPNSLVLVQEDFGGAPLSQWMEKWKCVGTVDFPLEHFLTLACRLAAELAKVHANGVIHKNINPSHIVFNPDTGELRLVDFGLATTLNRETPIVKNPEVLEGPLEYLSPEQTGRMNRVVDYRSDLYSLGVTLYELLAGRPPFTSDDPLALVHAHIAKMPQPVTDLNPSVPLIISDIVMRLLAKNAEDRYQSAFGLKVDLERCLAALSDEEGHERLVSQGFQLGQHDFSGQLQIPQKLYGRTGEIASLLNAFERVASGALECILVAGYAGVGKTALVSELHKPITGKRGYFISGKFDQLPLSTPYAAFSQALNQFADLILTEKEIALGAWRARILAAVGNNGAVLTEVIPRLESVIGVQPAVPKLPAVETRNRFILTFQAFVQVISTDEHPLVMFIDDWQWADAASLELLKALLTSETIRHLLLLGAYRDNEVDRTHPFMVAIDELKAVGTTVQTVVLDNLQLADVCSLIQESLSCSALESEDLAQLVQAKTLGNAFFVRQFLQNLYEEGRLRFDFEAHRWIWDLLQIETLELTNNVVDLMATKLKKLAPGTAKLLQLAACIGNEFDLRTLALISEVNETATVAQLAEPLVQGLVIPLDDYYKLPETAGLAHVSFLHDRVQQAAYSLIPESDRRPTHLHIGQLLLDSSSEPEKDEKLFEIVNHFNQGLELLIDRSKRLEVAELNRRAGHKAKGAAAFRAAWDHFTVARHLLPADSWQNEYGFTMEVYESSVETAYLAGELNVMAELFHRVLQNARTALDTVKVHEVIIQALTAQVRLREALEKGIQFVSNLGLTLPLEPSREDILAALADARSRCRGLTIPELVDLPVMTDPVQLAVIRILTSIAPAAFLSSPELYTMVVLKQVGLSIEYGNTSVSPICYASYGVVLCGEVTDIEAGYQFGRLALDLMERFEDKRRQCSVPSIVHSFITHWKQSVKDSLAPLMAAYHTGVENGDFQFAGYSAILYIAFAFLAGVGKDLPDMEREAASLSKSMQQMKQKTICHYFDMFRQGLHDLREGRSASQYLQGDFYNEQKMMPFHVSTSDWNGVYYIYFNKLILDYLFGNYVDAVEDAKHLELYLHHARSFPYGPVYYLFDALTRFAGYRQDPKDQREVLLRRIEEALRRLRTWAQYAPENCRHKVDLIEAERERTFGDPWKAGEAYDRAIAEARESGYLRDEAMANELAGAFYLDRGKARIAQVYVREAHACYARWGAMAKVRQLEQRYGWMLLADAESQVLQDNSTCKGGGSDGTPLDLLTVIKASQAIAGEIELKPLLIRMMRIVIESAGAQRGALLLERGGAWVIEALRDLDGDETQVLQGTELGTSRGVSAEIVHYVARTHTSVVLDNASQEGLFVQDPIVRQRGVKSVICTPLVNQGRLSGILYLENNLATHAFTADRLALLNLLSTQMALSLDNARLYSSLEASEHRFRTISEASFEGISLIRSGVFLDMNDQMTEMLGYSREELLGTSPLEIVAPQSRSLVSESMKRGRQETYEASLRRKDGTLFPVEIRAREVMIGHQKIRLTAVRDITERKRVEETLRESQEFLTSIVENIPNMIFIKNAEQLRFVRFNRAGEKLLGYRREDLIGKNDYDLFPEEQADFFTNKDREVLESGRLYDIPEEPIETKTGTRLLHTQKIPIMDKDGRPAYLLGISEDITERKHSEEERKKLQAQLSQAQKLESVGRLAGGVAHDFNNMLTAILGHTELAKMRCSPSEHIHTDLLAIEKAALRSADLIQQLLAFARKQTVVPKVLVLNDTVAGMLKMLQRLIGEDIGFAWVPGENLWPIKIDPTQVDQILANLCVNARDAISGVGRITIETQNVVLDRACGALPPESAPGNYVMLTVSDDGCGMDAETLEHVFEPFFTTKEIGKGTGLGLATVYGIVRQNGGFINVSSQPGRGTVFKICLPRCEEESVDLASETATETPRGHGETVLLVEDEGVLLAVGQAMLESLGYRVLTASTPGQAIQHIAAQAEAIQLLITDVIMPEMNGRDLATLLMNMKPGLKCIFASGYTADVIADQGIADEEVHFLQKPFSLHDMANTVHKVLERS